MTETKTPGAAGAMPVLYHRPVPISMERHGGKSLKLQPDLSFTKSVGAIPVTATELIAAARFYPVVFTGEGDPATMLVLGLRPDSNLFVDAAGKWEAGRYVPAYIRRYPFIFHENPQTQNFTLCIDEDAGVLEEGDARPLYKDGKPTRLLNDALKFCTEFQRDWAVMRNFGQTLARLDLLVPHRAMVRLENGTPLQVAGFRVVDEERLKKISDQAVLDLRRQNYWPLVYAHMFSMQCWQDLIARESRLAKAA